MKKIILILTALLLLTSNSLYSFSEENIAAYKQIYESLTDDSYHLKEAEKYTRKIEDLEQRLNPKQEEYNRLKRETDALLENARYINRRIQDMDQTLERLSLSTAREVLRVLLLLMTEATDAMTAFSLTDQAINYTEAILQEVVSSDEEEVPILVEFIRTQNNVAEARQEMWEDRDQQRDKANELLPRQRELEDQIKQMNREIETNVRQRDSHLSQHQNRIEQYLKTVPDGFKEAADASEREIDSAARDLQSAARNRTPDFSPFITLHEKLAGAIKNSRITGDEFETRWEATASQAQIHYRNADDADDKYREYQRKADDIKRDVETAKSSFLNKINEFDRQLLAIDTSFIPRFKSNYETRISNIKRVLNRKPDTDEPSGEEIARLEETSKTLAQRYSDLSAFLKTNGATFNQQLDEALNTFDEIFLERDMYLRAGENLADYTGYSAPDNLDKIEEKLKKGREIVTAGSLSTSNRLEVTQKASEYRKKAELYPVQVQANEDYKSAAEAFISAAENFRPNAQQAAEFYGEEIKEIKDLVSPLNSWENYYDRFLNDGRASMPWWRRISVGSDLHAYTMEDHLANRSKTENFLDSIRKYSHEYSILYGLYSELERAKFNLMVPSKEAQQLMDREKEARNIYSVYENFIDNSEDYGTALNRYLELVETLEEFKRNILADYQKSIDFYTSIINGYETSTDKESYVNQYFDESGQQKESEAAVIIGSYVNFIMPFRPVEISSKESQARSAQGRFAGIRGRIRQDFFTGPEITEMRMGNRTFRGRTRYQDRVAELARDDLTNAAVVIDGDLQVHGSPVEKVLVSKDGGSSYNYQAELTGSDSFRYQFRPDVGRAYHIALKAVDGRGNDGRRFPLGGSASFLYTGYSHEETLESFFKNLSESYSRQDLLSFMDTVSWNYVGRYENLERAVERDFENFEAIDIQFYINNISFSRDRKNATVQSRWRRSWTNINTGGRIQDEGENSFRLINDEGDWKLYSYSGPTIFGMTVDLAIESPAHGGSTSDTETEEDTGLSVRRGEELSGYDHYFSFSAGRVVESDEADITFDGFYIIPYDGAVAAFENTPLEDVTTAPADAPSGEDWGEGYDAYIGTTYVIYCKSGNYAKFEIIDMTKTVINENEYEVIHFDWSYQPDGSRDLR